MSLCLRVDVNKDHVYIIHVYIIQPMLHTFGIKHLLCFAVLLAVFNSNTVALKLTKVYLFMLE